MRPELQFAISAFTSFPFLECHILPFDRIVVSFIGRQ